ncbi:dockerin type I domain-containing protein [Haliscomenobacter hydrossis]|nr:dockerin type I domain-containing protein [Haliscomenobacter hydrossis]
MHVLFVIVFFGVFIEDHKTQTVMKFLIPRTNLSDLLFMVSALSVFIFAPAQTSNWKQIQAVHFNQVEHPEASEPVIVFHCIDWIKDTLPSYDLDFVLNNPSTIGNPGFVESPKVTTNDPQIIPNAKWRDKKGAGACNYEPVNLEYDSVSNLGYIYARAINGDSTCQTSLFWRDRVEYYSCEDILKNGGIYARIFRRWAAICGGARKDTVQVISFARPRIKDFVFNVNGEEIGHEGFDRVVTYQACSGDKSLIKKEDVTPYVDSYFSSNLKPKPAFIDGKNGKYRVDIQDQDFPICGGIDLNRGWKIVRSLLVFDSCQAAYIDTFRVIIKIGDYKGPAWIKPQQIPEIYTEPQTCTASFYATATDLKQKFGLEVKDCHLGGISAYVEVKDRYVNGVLVAENVWDKLPNSIYNNNTISLSEGHYRLILFAGDACFNTSQDTCEFIVKDKSAPAPICVDGLTVELLPDGNGGGKFTLHAADFIAEGIYDCYGQGPDTNFTGQRLVTHYSINRVGERVDSSQKKLELDCAQVGRVVLIELHAWDTRGKHDYCVTYVEVMDENPKSCHVIVEPGYISGTVSTEGNTNVQGVTVTISGSLSGVFTTNSNGGYSFLIYRPGGEYTVTPKLDKNPLNGVSTFDLLLIQKHILGIQVLNSPYKMIAADVNNSKSISTLDLIQLRKLILGLDLHFLNNTSWRFIDAAYVFPDPTKPWLEKFPEEVYINNLTTNSNGNFVAIKIGDMNASAKVNTSE